MKTTVSVGEAIQMKILVCGGSYINLSQQTQQSCHTQQTQHTQQTCQSHQDQQTQQTQKDRETHQTHKTASPTAPRLAGGAVISSLIASHSHHDVYLQTNFSTEEQKVTKSYQKFLQNHWVNPVYTTKVSSPYGRIYESTLIPGSNIFESANTIKRDARFSTFDVCLLTTDISERDFRSLLQFAHQNRMKTVVVTAKEYPLPKVYQDTIVIELPIDNKSHPSLSVNRFKKDEDMMTQGVLYTKTPAERENKTPAQSGSNYNNWNDNIHHHPNTSKEHHHQYASAYASDHNDHNIYHDDNKIPPETAEFDQLPVYHEHLNFIKQELHQQKLIEAGPVTRHDKKPKAPIQKVWRFIVQLISIAILVTGATLIILYAFDWFSPDEETFEVSIDENMPVNDGECDTVKTCRELGDQYLDELHDYIDILDEPHVFFENRTQTNYVDYTVDENFNLSEKIEYSEEETLPSESSSVEPEEEETSTSDQIEYEEEPIDIAQAEETELPVGTEDEFKDIWSRFTTIFPDDYIEDVSHFRLFSDGEGNTLAYVTIEEDGVMLAVDIRDNQNRAAEYRTLIHEFGHIYSLPAADFEADCNTGTDIECLKDDTLMANYIERFWSQYGENWLENGDKTSYEREAFFNNHITDFYVPYQATNAKEDYAVTFQYFITREIPSPESSQLRDIKVRAFYENSELVKLRTEILRNLVDLEKERAAS